MDGNAEDLVRQADSLFREGKYQESTALCQSLLTREGDGGRGAACSCLGWNHLCLGLVKEARNCFGECFAVMPHQVDTLRSAHSGMAALELHEGHHGAALEHCLAYLGLSHQGTEDQDELTGYVVNAILGTLTADRGDPPVAQLYLDRAIGMREHYPKDPCGLSLLRPTQLLIKKAEALSRLVGNDEEEIEVLDKALRLNCTGDEEFRALVAMGGAYTKTGEPERSASCLEKALSLSDSLPNALFCYFHLGCAYAVMGDDTRALESFEKAFLAATNSSRNADKAQLT